VEKWVWRLSGELDAAALHAAFDEIVSRHEVLRTRYYVVDGEPVQLIGEHTEVALPVTDLSPLPANEREHRLNQLIDEHTGTPFALGHDMPLRLRLVRLAHDEHLLLMAVHHIAFDGWSIGVLVRELADRYAAFVTGTGAAAAPPPVQYADFAEWQHKRSASTTIARQFEYWRRQLSGPSLLEIPTDRSRPAVYEPAGAGVPFTVPSRVGHALRDLGRAHRATSFMVFLTAFQTMLARYSGQTDIAVGTPTAGRSRPELQNLLGLCLNTVVIRADLSGGPSFADLLDQVRETALAAYVNQEVPFEWLVDRLAPERDLSRNPLFSHMFILQNNGTADFASAGVRAESLPLPPRSAKFDLTLQLTEQPDGSLHGVIEYATALFDRETIERMSGHYLRLLDSIAADPGASVTDLAMISAAERQRVLVEWNDTAGPIPTGRTIHDLVAEQAVVRPDEPAVVCGDQMLTHGELHARANRLAAFLRDRGVGTDDVVGVFLDRGPDLIVALLAVLKAGGAYLPLDPEHPAERLAFMLDDTAARMVITQSGLAGHLPERTDRLLVDEDWPLVASYPADEPAPRATPSDLAYVFYTSGTTGMPKGVLIEHGGVVNYLAGMQHAFPIRPADCFLQATPLTFDVSAYEIFWPLWQGGTVVLVPGATRLDMAHIGSLMRRHRIVGLHFVPSLMDMFVAQVDPADCPGLRYAFCSGEALPGPLVRRFTDRFGGELINLYGATEVSVDTTYWHAVSDAPVLAGRPMLNQRVYVLDGARQPVPIGAVGEVYLGGRCVGRGYLNRSELTAERFCVNPFGDDPDDRMYRTGDLGRFTADGELDVLGRIDNQVKLRGVRIEPGEIEAVLLSHPDVTACAVVVREDPEARDKHLVAYCVSAAGEVDGAALRARCQRTLPPAMVPAVFVTVPVLPLSANGKVDRSRLPAPDLATLAPSATHVAPSDEIEEALAEVWTGVLGLDRVGIHDNFFEVGGHSLRAIQLVNQVEGLTGIRISLRDLFQAPTIVGIKTQLLEQIEDQS
jgi:amino acid adenylation domain-containing protein